MPRKPNDDAIARLGKALSDPVKVYVLRTILERGEASPNDLVEGSGSTLGTVSFHLRVLADLGALTLVRTEPRPGAVAHFYAVPPKMAGQLRAVLTAF